MASVTMMASFSGAAAVARGPRSLVVAAKATTAPRAEGEAKPDRVGGADVEEKVSGRRAAMFAAAAVAVSVVGPGVASADEPKRGTPEARKAYAPICVTMPTARVCNKIA